MTIRKPATRVYAQKQREEGTKSVKNRSQRLPLQPGLSCKAKTIFRRFAGWDESVLTLLLMGVPGPRSPFAERAKQWSSGASLKVAEPNPLYGHAQ